jgi:threonyl-tRNA synthetase
MADINLGRVIEAATSLNCCEKYEDGTDMYEMAGKIILYFDKEKAAESVSIPIIFKNGDYTNKGNIIIHRDGNFRYEFEEAQA